LGALVEASAVIGRITPDQKRAVITALQARGHAVAMTGDGVNDVLALKHADLGVAMGSGTDATRAVAPVVLLDDDFSVLPGLVAEGRRVIANIERVANLFVTKTVYALLLALAVASARLPYPFFPRHLTVVSSLAIGTPAFFLALAPNARMAKSGFLRRVAWFTVPTGAVAAATVMTTYLVARHQSGVTAVQVRSAAMLALLGVSLWVPVALARPLTPWRFVLVGAMASGCAVLFGWPWAERVLSLGAPNGALRWWTIGLAMAGAALVELVWRRVRERVVGSPVPELRETHP
jgi:cation-transporting ATPase E